MATDEERLVVLLEARIRDYERNLKKASGTTGTEFGKMRRTSASATAQMEADMVRSTSRINQALAATSTQIGVLSRSMVGMFAGGILAGGAVGFVGGVRSVIAELSEMGKQIDRVGLSAKVFQELQYGFELAGVSASDFTRGVESFTQRIGEAATKGNELTKIFQANNVALRDAAGNIRSNEALLRDYADLIKNAASEQEQMTLATRAFGEDAGRKFVNALKNGADGIDDMADAAANAGGVIDEELIRKAEIFDDRFTEAWRRAEINGKTALMTVIDYMDQMSEHPLFSKLGGLFAIKDLIENPSWRNLSDWMITPTGTSLIFGDETTPEAAPDDRETPESNITTRPTILPTVSTTGTGSRGARSRNAAAMQAVREAEAVAALVEQLEFEQSQIGKTDTERRKAEALRKAGSAATDEQRRQIGLLIEQIDRETAALKAAEQAREDFAEGMDQLSTDALDALGNVIAGTEDAADAFKKLAIEIVKSALTGKGAYSDFFASMSKGGDGNIFGRLLGGLGNMASGSQWQIAARGGAGLYATGTANTGGVRGEPRGVVHGQEAVIPLPNGGRVPVQVQTPAGKSQNGSNAMQVDVRVGVDRNGNLEAWVTNIAQIQASGAVSKGLRNFEKHRQNRYDNGGQY